MPKFTDVELRALGIGDHTDGDGLIFVVKRSRKEGKLLRRWVFRIQIGGKRRNFGLGPYPSLGAAKARKKAIDYRCALDDGIDPGVRAKRRQQAAQAGRTLTLSKAINNSLAVALPYKNAKSTAIRERALRVHFAPFHTRDVTTITAADVAGVLRTLTPQTAIKAHAAIRRVFDYAITTLEAHGVHMVNPADPRRLRHVGWSGQSPKASTPHPSLEWRRMPEFMAELARHDCADARCLDLAILTVVRAGSARLAKWKNVDLGRGIWSVPIPDLKDSKHRTAPFVVPLSTAAHDLIKALPRCGAFLFPNAAGQPISDQAIGNLMRRLHHRGGWKDPVTGKPVVAHGFRSSFRTWAKALRLDREIAELSMGHAFYKSSENPYARDDDEVLALRRQMIEAWGRHCAGQSAEVIPLRRVQ